MLADRSIGLDLSDEAIDWLADKGYDPAYGARPLKRVIQKYLQDPLAEQLLGGEIHDHSVTSVGCDETGLTFSSGRSVH